MMSGGNNVVFHEKLGLYGDSQVVLCRLEGATDSRSFGNTVGVRSEAVFEAQNVYGSK